ncbi:MAG: Ku protein [Deltaproteobacteria bacterium]|nr:Ku protein [Deltaproteobacteria bacterium]MDQ3301164.1 Ku protein [Myxococcota bacterium]
MPARSIDTATISFGLVSIPVKVYSTSEPSQEIHFHLVHEGCGERLKQQYVCPKHGKVERDEMVKGFEITKGNVIELDKSELKALEAVASDEISLAEFVPAEAVDPLYIDRSYYLGPGKGGDRAYRLFRDALEHSSLVGIAAYAARGKQYIVMVRPYEDGLVMHQLRYPDEIKPWSEVPLGKLPKAAPAELGLAARVIDQLTHEEFDPSQYADEVKGRVRKLIAKKAKGGEITVPESAPEKPEAVDLMAALKASLGGGELPRANGEAKNGHAKNGRAKTADAKKSATSHARKAPARTKRASHAKAARPARGHRPAASRSRAVGSRRSRAHG